MPIGFDKEAATKKSSNKNVTNQQEDAHKSTAPRTERNNKARGADGATARDSVHTAKPDTNAEAPQEDFDDDDFNIEKKGKSKKPLYIAIAVIAVIAIGLAYTYATNNTPEISDDGQLSATEDPSTDSANAGDMEGDDPYIYDENGKPIYSAENNSVVDNESIDPGEADYANSTKSETVSKTFNPDDMIKDINGVDISATYNVTSRDYVYDYVSYVAKRGIIDDGMEVYWLDATYAGKKYRIQVPFYYFKDLNAQGVCRVQMEVLNIEGGGKVISYMQVVENPTGDDSE